MDIDPIKIAEDVASSYGWKSRTYGDKSHLFARVSSGAKHLQMTVDHNAGAKTVSITCLCPFRKRETLVDQQTELILSYLVTEINTAYPIGGFRFDTTSGRIGFHQGFITTDMPEDLLKSQFDFYISNAKPYCLEAHPLFVFILENKTYPPHWMVKLALENATGHA